MYNTTQNDAMFYDRKLTITIVYKIASNRIDQRATPLVDGQAISGQFQKAIWP